MTSSIQRSERARSSRGTFSSSRSSRCAMKRQEPGRAFGPRSRRAGHRVALPSWMSVRRARHAGVAVRFVELGTSPPRTTSSQGEPPPARRSRRGPSPADETGPLQRRGGGAWASRPDPAETIAARIISSTHRRTFAYARVEARPRDGVVQRGMPVLTPEGVVGRIGHISADVGLMSARRSRLRFDRRRPRTAGAASCSASSSNVYAGRSSTSRSGAPGPSCDKVVTSGLGGAFPRDLPVGQRHAVPPGALWGLFQDSRSRPTVDFARLSEVARRRCAPPPPIPRGRAPRGGAPARRANDLKMTCSDFNDSPMRSCSIVVAYLCSSHSTVSELSPGAGGPWPGPARRHAVGWSAVEHSAGGHRGVR